MWRSSRTCQSAACSAGWPKPARAFSNCARVRADIALKYLRQSNLQAAQIGEILGYSEPAAFTRAFQRQHGITPRQARCHVDRKE